ncbi:MAG: hypothetical protein WC781_02755 [Candidatus Pacearchaeota archaeon]|jgi:hypothetical protein
MITYNDIYECLRRERYSEQLQPLSKKFVSEVSEYIKEKRVLANQNQQGDMFSDEILKIKKQLENSVSIFNELMLLRKKKLLGLVFVASETGMSKRDFENMLDFEKELFDKIIISVQEAEKILSSEFTNGGDAIKIEKQLKLVLFLEDVEEFMGINGESLGPFRKDEVANIPREIADILVSGKKVEIVVEE